MAARDPQQSQGTLAQQRSPWSAWHSAILRGHATVALFGTVHADVRNILLESGFIAILNRHRATDWVWHRLAHVHVQHHALDCHAVQVTKRALCLPELTDTPSNPFIPVLGPWYSMTLLHHALAHSDCNTVIRVPLTFQAPPIHLVCFRNDSNQHHDYQRMRALRCTCRGAEQNVLDPIMT